MLSTINRSSFTQLLVILSSGLLCLVGCEPVQQHTVDPNMLVANESQMAPAPAAADTVTQQEQAVSLYVDAMMLNDLNEREEGCCQYVGYHQL